MNWKELLETDAERRADFDAEFIGSYLAGAQLPNERLEKCIKALEFYADRDNWSNARDTSTSHMIGPDDHDQITGYEKHNIFHAGAQARKIIAHLRKEMEGSV